MMTITRKGLYGKVWSNPTTELSEVLGISDVAIAKLCKKLNVPKPPRGYWEKIKYGHQVSRPPLPQPKAISRIRSLFVLPFGVKHKPLRRQVL